MQDQKVMFANIEYNHKSNRIHLWYYVDDKRIYETFPYKHKVWVDSEEETGYVDLHGTPKKPITFKNKKESKGIIDPSNPTSVCEQDLNEKLKFLNERYGKVEMTPDVNNLNICYFDIENSVDDDMPNKEVCDEPINSIALYFTKTKALYVLGLFPYTGTKDKEYYEKESGIKIDKFSYFHIPDEDKLMTTCFQMIKKLKTDVLSGWNIKTYDIPYMINRAKLIGVTESISPLGRVQKRNHDMMGLYYIIEGITILDYLEIYRDKFTFTNLPDFKLDTVCQVELKKGKLKLGMPMKRAWRENWNLWTEYNIMDTLRVAEIDKACSFMNNSIQLASECLVPLGDIVSTVTPHTGLTLKFMHNKNMVLNNKEIGREKIWYPGGYAYAHKGIYKYVISFDFQSLYPGIIRQNNVGLETLRKDVEDIYELSFDGRVIELHKDTPLQIERSGVKMIVTLLEIREGDEIIYDQEALLKGVL
jgi:DNA polymerase elongation subunit (family B)